tara:strand:+ start:343 stop:687 length:345 start_codon:yes stop_codon:yes gene_type:complete
MVTVELVFNDELSRSAGYAVLERLKTQLNLDHVYFADEGFEAYTDYSIAERRSGGEFDVLRLTHMWDGLDYDCDAVIVADSRTFEQALKIVALEINGRWKGLSEKLISALQNAV